jgi:hypothetical protein
MRRNIKQIEKDLEENDRAFSLMAGHGNTRVFRSLNDRHGILIKELKSIQRGCCRRNETGLAEGIWFAVEYLVCARDEPSLAEELIKETCIDVKVFRKILSGTGYETKTLAKLLDGIK